MKKTFIILFTIISFLFLNSVYCYDTTTKDEEEKAINYLITNLTKLQIYSKRYPKFPSCIMYVTEEMNKHFIEIRLREEHNDSDCKGDPNVSPTLDLYRVMLTKPMKIYIYNVSKDSFFPLHR